MSAPAHEVMARTRRVMRRVAACFVLAGIVAAPLSASGAPRARAAAPAPQAAVADGVAPASGCGSWAIVPSPSPRASHLLEGVAALSSDDAWAVGYVAARGRPGMPVPTNTLIEHWNGTSWSMVPSPSPGPLFNQLYAVAALSARDVWAVGLYYPFANRGPSQTLIEHWDGTSWSIVPSPSPGSGFNDLYGVTAVAAGEVWAVGDTANGGLSASRTLIEHWDGAGWSVAPSPSPGLNSNVLFDVASVSAGDVWAVGNYYNDNVHGHTLIEHWNGAAWSLVPSPDVGVIGSFLSGVAVVSAGDVWAVGTFWATPDINHTLIEHWNGTAWSVVPSPDPGTATNALAAVAVVAARDVWAVGYWYDFIVPGFSGTLTVRWDGTAWRVVPSPAPSAALLGIASVPGSGQLWVVGDYILHWTPC